MDWARLKFSLCKAYLFGTEVYTVVEKRELERDFETE